MQLPGGSIGNVDATQVQFLDAEELSQFVETCLVQSIVIRAGWLFDEYERFEMGDVVQFGDPSGINRTSVEHDVLQLGELS